MKQKAVDVWGSIHAKPAPNNQGTDKGAGVNQAYDFSPKKAKEPNSRILLLLIRLIQALHKDGNNGPTAFALVFEEIDSGALIDWEKFLVTFWAVIPAVLNHIRNLP